MVARFGPYPYAPFDGPVQPPSIVNEGGFCVEIDRKWLPYMIALLYTLTADQTWASDQERVIGEANNIILAFERLRDCGPDMPDTTGVEVSEDCDVKLRICGGKLQVCDCGVWVDVPSCDGEAGTGMQPGQGSPQPTPGGGSQRYCGAMSSGSVWLLPTPVNTGDQILFSDLLGAWNDEDEIIWNCPDGWVYAAGACGQTLPHGSPDPLPTGLHMAIVGVIGGTFYDVLNLDFAGSPQPFTIPAGVSNQNLLIQANIDDLSKVNGEVTFCVTVTNNASLAWSHELDLTVSPGGFGPYSDSIFTSIGNWVPGSGFESQSVIGSNGTYYVAAAFKRTLSEATNITRMRVFYDLTIGTISPGGVGAYEGDQAALFASINWASLVTGDGQVLDSGAQTSSSTEVYAFIGASNVAGGPFGGGSVRIYKVIIEGTGFDPYA